MKKLKAFTLAEVLITLGVIGVVAAMTMPTLIKSYNEKVTVSKVKKTYSILNQAIQLAINEHGNLDTWFISGQGNNIRNNEIFLENIKPYLKILKNCGNDGNCLFNKEYKTMNSGVWQSFNLAPYNYLRLILADGTQLFFAIHNDFCRHEDTFSGYNNTCGYLFIDINGNNKQPNIIGQDAFYFVILKEGLALPIVDNCSNKLPKNQRTGWSCSTLIMQNGNMNYLKK